VKGNVVSDDAQTLLDTQVAWGAVGFTLPGPLSIVVRSIL
jgi:hypothetical protein